MAISAAVPQPRGAPSYIQANTGGRLHPASEPSLSPLNRGFLYGDAIYEVWRTYGRTLFAWEEHWRRLENSAAALHLALPWTAGEMLAEIRRTAAAFRECENYDGEIYARLQIARGEGAIGLDVALAGEAEFAILVQRCPETSPAKLAQGLTLAVAQGIRRNPPQSLDPAWKTGNYLNNILCLREARQKGADEAVILNLAGEIAEAAVCNLAFAKDGALISPPLGAGILAGITRALVLRSIAPAAGVPTREETVRPEDLADMDECFLLSTTKDVAPVSAIDHHRYRVGAGTVGERLKRAFGDYARRYADSRPELRV